MVPDDGDVKEPAKNIRPGSPAYIDSPVSIYMLLCFGSLHCLYVSGQTQLQSLTTCMLAPKDSVIIG